MTIDRPKIATKHLTTVNLILECDCNAYSVSLGNDAMDDSTRKIRRELLTGTTSIAVLAMLVKSSEPLYGYQIGMRWINHDGESSEVNQGALYPVLRSLEKQELLTSKIIPSEAGPPRKYYSPTPLGRKVFQEWCAEWSQTRDWLDSILEPKHGRGKRHPTRSS